MVRYTAYRRIYEKFSFLTRPRGQNGRILRPSRAMSGSAGLSPSRSRKPEGSTLSVYARNLKKECADLVAGQAVRTAEIRTGTCIRHHSLPRSGSPLSIPRSRASAHEARAPPFICGLFLGRQASMPTELHPRKPRPSFDPKMFGLVPGSRHLVRKSSTDEIRVSRYLSGETSRKRTSGPE
jgi:hypothetical protein